MVSGARPLLQNGPLTTEELYTNVHHCYFGCDEVYHIPYSFRFKFMFIQQYLFSVNNCIAL